jgi:hypothetical protein
VTTSARNHGTPGSNNTRLSFHILERDLWRLAILINCFDAHFICIEFGGRIVLIGAKSINALFISIAFGGRIVLVRAPRFIRIAFGGRIVLVGSLLDFRGFT